MRAGLLHKSEFARARETSVVQSAQTPARPCRRRRLRALHDDLAIFCKGTQGKSFILDGPHLVTYISDLWQFNYNISAAAVCEKFDAVLLETSGLSVRSVLNQVLMFRVLTGRIPGGGGQ